MMAAVRRPQQWGTSASPALTLWFNNDFHGTTYSAVSWGALLGGMFAVWLVAVPGLERITTPGKAASQGALLTGLLALAFISHVQGA